MASTGKTRAEQETVVRWDEEEKVVHIWTASPVTLRKIARLGLKGTGQSGTYTLPLARFRWGLKRVGVPGRGFAKRAGGAGEAP